MRTTLNIPDELLGEAQALLGFTSKTDVVIFSLRELLRRSNIEALKGLAGKVPLQVDLEKSRRRPARRRS